MTDFYGNKDDVVEAEKEIFRSYAGALHPEDEAQAYREMSEWASERAKECEERNDRMGVPDRREERSRGR